MDSVDWKLLLACAHNIISRIWLSHPSASPGVRGSVSSSSCTCHSKTQWGPRSKIPVLVISQSTTSAALAEQIS